jgi:serine/threonine-protein kinase
VVISSEPAAGEEVLSGSTVLLVVSKGPAPVPVPNLIGLTANQANAAVSGVGLVLNVSNTRQPVADPDQDGKVVNQIPAPGVEVDPDSIVTVTLGEYTPPPTTTTIPDPTTTIAP